MISSTMPYSFDCCAFMIKSRSTSRSMRSRRLAGVLGHQRIGNLADAQDFARVNIDVGCLAAQSTHRGLMNQNPRVGQRETLALGAGQQQKRAHAGRLPDTIRHHVVLDELHGVVDRQPRGDGAAGRIDIERDVLLRVLTLQKKHLGNDEIGYLVVNGRAKKDDVVA